MIQKFEVYEARCCACRMCYPGIKAMPDHPHLYFPSMKEAEKSITAAGWCVMHNQEDSCPRILCPVCFDEAENAFKNVVLAEES